jgi:hypothetical protein
MFGFLQVLSLTLTAVAMAMALAHALELPGKMRLDRETYFAMQAVYYPGFTVGGAVGEVGGAVCTIVLLVLTPRGERAFWLTLVAALGLVAMHAVYWLVTRRCEQVPGRRRPSRPFPLGVLLGWHSRSGRHGRVGLADVARALEYSHVVGAGCAVVSLTALIITTSCGG